MGYSTCLWSEADAGAPQFSSSGEADSHTAPAAPSREAKGEKVVVSSFHLVPAQGRIRKDSEQNKRLWGKMSLPGRGRSCFGTPPSPALVVGTTFRSGDPASGGARLQRHPLSLYNIFIFLSRVYMMGACLLQHTCQV